MENETSNEWVDPEWKLLNTSFKGRRMHNTNCPNKSKNQQATHQNGKIEDLIIVNEEKKGRINQKKFYAL